MAIVVKPWVALWQSKARDGRWLWQVSLDYEVQAGGDAGTEAEARRDCAAALTRLGCHCPESEWHVG